MCDSPATPAAATTEYAIVCSYDGSGEVYNCTDEVKWRFSTDRGRKCYLLSYFAFPTPFRFFDTMQRQLLTIKCEHHYPYAVFTILEDEHRIGTIYQKSLLLNTYDIVLERDSTRWRFHMPFFTVYFRGSSDTSEAFHVRMRYHGLWYVRISPSNDNVPLMASLAFIHREWNQFGGFDRQWQRGNSG